MERGGPVRAPIEPRREDLLQRLRDLEAHQRELARALEKTLRQIAFYKSYQVLMEGVTTEALKALAEAGAAMPPPPTPDTWHGAPATVPFAHTLAKSAGPGRPTRAVPRLEASEREETMVPGGPPSMPAEPLAEPPGVSGDGTPAPAPVAPSAMETAPASGLTLPPAADSRATIHTAVDLPDAVVVAAPPWMQEQAPEEERLESTIELPPMPFPPRALLVSRSGRAFELKPSGVTLGRSDPQNGIFPQVDLAAENPQHSIHRRHARIFYRDDHWYLTEEPGVRNGTFVNRRPVKPGESVPLHDGDHVRLARLQPVDLVFRIPSQA